MLYLFNTLSKTKELFVPINASQVKMYVCGPTVYDYIHIGNARPVVVFDTLYRVLKYLYKDVVYVRNITDVDDKIINRSRENNELPAVLTQKTIKSFHEDIAKINAIAPTFEPKATNYIAKMIAMIESLISHGYAYVARGHVYFDVKSYPDYGQLSGISMEEILHGARIEVSDLKKNSEDFVLWKPAAVEDNCGWDSPFGYGRPGWHMECSAMSVDLLGENFDIHGGGKDLIFPHHENEIAQSVCYFHRDADENRHQHNNVANYWVHNDFVVVDGQKMSKSLGNFTTLNAALKKHHGEVVRLSLLKTHYRSPLDFSQKSLQESTETLDKFYDFLNSSQHIAEKPSKPNAEFLSALCDDLNTHLAISILYKMLNEAKSNPSVEAKSQLLASANMLGLLYENPQDWFTLKTSKLKITENEIEQLLEKRSIAKQNKDFKESDRIRDYLGSLDIIIEDSPTKTTWRIK
ncbi:MAG: cysteine--tRNA ligase [Alphaproteobacteria bacterium]|jgi:cysteinyl-tRNA synthetase|nr:cysteine--tRNA ligase [Alphaproteobacteria bacterium]